MKVTGVIRDGKYGCPVGCLELWSTGACNVTKETTLASDGTALTEKGVDNVFQHNSQKLKLDLQEGEEGAYNSKRAKAGALGGFPGIRFRQSALAAQTVRCMRPARTPSVAPLGPTGPTRSQVGPGQSGPILAVARPPSLQGPPSDSDSTDLTDRLSDSLTDRTGGQPTDRPTDRSTIDQPAGRPRKRTNSLA